MTYYVSVLSVDMRKIKKRKSGESIDDAIFTSNWEFFDSLKFLIGAMTCGDITFGKGNNNLRCYRFQATITRKKEFILQLFNKLVKVTLSLPKSDNCYCTILCIASLYMVQPFLE